MTTLLHQGSIKVSNMSILSLNDRFIMLLLCAHCFYQSELLPPCCSVKAVVTDDAFIVYVVDNSILH
jgi:hypothetical protein